MDENLEKKRQQLREILDEAVSCYHLLDRDCECTRKKKAAIEQILQWEKKWKRKSK